MSSLSSSFHCRVAGTVCTCLHALSVCVTVCACRRLLTPRTTTTTTTPQAFPALKTLAIHDCALLGEVPECVGEWRDLENLQLQCNQLGGRIPESVGALRCLASMPLCVRPQVVLLLRRLSPPPQATTLRVA